MSWCSRSDGYSIAVADSRAFAPLGATRALKASSAIDAVRAHARHEGGVLGERGDQLLLERRLLDELKAIFHEDPAQPRVVREPRDLRGRVGRGHVVEGDGGQRRAPAQGGGLRGRGGGEDKEVVPR